MKGAPFKAVVWHLMRVPLMLSMPLWVWALVLLVEERRRRQRERREEEKEEERPPPASSAGDLIAPLCMCVCHG
jgi:hypothetical protein